MRLRKYGTGQHWRYREHMEGFHLHQGHRCRGDGNLLSAAAEGGHDNGPLWPLRDFYDDLAPYCARLRAALARTLVPQSLSALRITPRPQR